MPDASPQERPAPPAARPRRPRRRRAWAKLLAAAIAFAAMIPFMELAVRLLAPRPPSWLAIYRRHPALPTFALLPDARAEVDTGESRWTVRTDAQGFRVPRDGAPADPRPVALWLGDSYTFGQGVDFEDTYVGRLAADPSRRDRHVDAGVGGYGPIQYRQTLEYVLARGLRPRVVLVGTFLGNDFFDCIWSKDVAVHDGVLADDGGWKSFIRRRSHLYRLAAAALHRFRPPPIRQDLLDREMADPRSWSDGELAEAERVFRRELQRIAALCREHGIALAVLVIPRDTTVDAVARGGAPAGGDPALPRDRAVAILRELGIRHLDLTPVLAGRPVAETYFPHDGHFTPRGHALAADAMRAAWADLLLR